MKNNGNDLATLGISTELHEPISMEEMLQIYHPHMWLDREKKILNENVFAKFFRDVNNLSYSNGLFYTKDRRANPEMIQHDIWRSISEDEQITIDKDVDKTVKKLFGAVKLASTVESLKANPNVIPFKNGDYIVSEKCLKVGYKSSVPYRFPVELHTEFQKMPTFVKWLNDLFYKEDIIVIQEFLGYCLVPTTKAQKALFLVGEGGTGKSRIGVILEALLGEDAMISISNYKEFISDKFKLAEMEHALVLYDDDLDNSALENTGVYKKLITNELSITAERKFGQPFKMRPATRFISSCNEMLVSAYDNTDGFYRRLLPIIVKPKARDFKPDPNFSDKLRAEAEGIVQWALWGLLSLIDNNWCFHESQRTIDYLNQKRGAGNHIPDFIESCLDIGEGYTVTSLDLFNVYRLWCRQNAVDAWSQRALSTWMIDNCEKYGMKYSTNVPVENGRRLRGYFGAKVNSKWINTTNLLSIK